MKNTYLWQHLFLFVTFVIMWCSMSRGKQNRGGNIIPAFASVFFTHHSDMVWWKCKKNSHTVLCIVSCCELGMLTCSFVFSIQVKSISWNKTIHLLQISSFNLRYNSKQDVFKTVSLNNIFKMHCLKTSSFYHLHFAL